MDKKFLTEMKVLYQSRLLENVIPFWLKNSQDHKHGGYVTCLKRDGSVYELTKICMWNHGRMIWTFSHFYNELYKNSEWLQMARHGVDFVLKHGFSPNGKMFYSLSRDGQPLQASQDIFTELFNISGFSEYARATDDETLAERAWQMFCVIWGRLQRPGQACQPLIADSVPLRMFGHPLICLNVLYELRRYKHRVEMTAMIDQCLDWIFNYHTKPERKLSFELVQWNGKLAPGHWGRRVTPGHMIEAGIFVIHEAKHRGDQDLIHSGLELIDWGFELGWDEEFGGIYNDVDVEDKPIPDRGAYLAHSKLWWQHSEALYGLLLAYTLTDDKKYKAAYQKVHDYSFTHFDDPEYGEWFGLLDQRGNRIDDAKGSSRKSIFHVGRNFYYCYKLLEQLS